MAMLRSIRPMLDVPDMPGTVAFWTGTLGFKVIAQIDDDAGRPLWAQVERDGIRIMFTTHYHDDEDEPPHDAELTGSIYIDVDDVDGLAREMEGKVDLIYGPDDQPHGMREMAIHDNSGYVVMFGQPI
jgi:uncharacterized glyoxalase superfamily protein PhnB